MLSILLVEDDKDLNEILSSYLRKAGYSVTSTFNGLDALKELDEQNYDLVISDIMMPLCDGYELARSIREFNTQIPIIFMSARDDKPSKQMGYKIGIDDYVTKPFDMDELVFKVNAIARRLNISRSNSIEIGNFKMIEDEHVALINGEEISLTVREFDILFKMLSYPKKTFSRGKLMEDFWGFDSSATSRTVDVCMSKIREKTKECNGFEIATVHGLGYKVILR